MKEALPSPDVFRYLDFRRYMSDWFRWKKLKNPRFSHRMVARMAGRKGSGWFANIASGAKTPSAASVRDLVGVMRLDGEAAEFFELLASLATARTIEERTERLEQIFSHPLSEKVRQVEGAYWEYLSEWYHVAIRELAALGDFCPDADWVRRRLSFRLSHDEAVKGIETLRRLGMIARDEEGRWRAAEPHVETGAEISGVIGFHYHRAMLRLAERSLELPGSSRFVGAATLPVSADRVEGLRQEVFAFLRKMTSQAHLAEGDPEHVLQLNVQLFPFTTSGDGDAEDDVE